MALSFNVNVNLSKLKRFQESLQADLRLSGNGPVREALHEWGAIIARFLTKRFFIFSLGGGNWKPLKPATLKAKKQKGLLPWILRATDLLFESFNPVLARKPGKITEEIPFGVRVGFGPNMRAMRYPGTNTSVAEVATYHQKGMGNLPVRKTIVPPDAPTIKEMRDVMAAAVKKSEERS